MAAPSRRGRLRSSSSCCCTSHLLLPIPCTHFLSQAPCHRCLQNSVACILSQSTGCHLACNLCTTRKFKCEPSGPPLSSRPPRSLPAVTVLPLNVPAPLPKSDPPARSGPSTPKGHLLPQGHHPSAVFHAWPLPLLLPSYLTGSGRASGVPRSYQEVQKQTPGQAPFVLSPTSFSLLSSVSSFPLQC